MNKVKRKQAARPTPNLGVRKVNPRGATVLINMPKGKKKVALYGLI